MKFLPVVDRRAQARAKDKIARLPLDALRNAANTAVDVSTYKLDPKPDSARARNINCEMQLLDVMVTSVVELHPAKEAAEAAAAAASDEVRAEIAKAVEQVKREAADSLAAYKVEAAKALADAVAKVKKTAEDAHHMAAAAKAATQLAYLLRELVKTTLKGFTGETLRDRAQTAWKMVQEKRGNGVYENPEEKEAELTRMVKLLCKIVDDGNETVHPDMDIAAELTRMLDAKELVGHYAATARAILHAGGARAPTVGVAPAAAAGAGAPAASAAAAGGAGAATPDDEDGWTTVGPRGTKVATSPASVPSGGAVAAAGTGSAKAGASAASSLWVAAVRKAGGGAT